MATSLYLFVDSLCKTEMATIFGWIRDADSDGSDSGDADFDNDSVRYPGSLLGCQDTISISASGL